MRHTRRWILAAALFILSLEAVSGSTLFPRSEFAARRGRLMEKISEGVAVIWGAAPGHGGLGFRQNNDFYYFTGVEVPNAVLILDGTRRESLLFLSISERQADSMGISLELLKNPEEFTGIETVLERDRFAFTLARFCSKPGAIYTKFKPEELYRETSNEKFNALQRFMTLNPWDGRLTRELQFVQHLKDKFPQATVKDCSPLIWNLRKIKTPAEIEFMRTAGRIAAKAHIALIQSTRVGIKEKELAALFEYVCKKEGADDLAFDTIIMSGKNHAYGHYHIYDRTLQSGDFLILDAGADFGHYKVDFSSSFPANGRFTPRQKEMYTLADEIRRLCIRAYRPGISFKQVGQKIADFLQEKGIDSSHPEYKHFRGIIRWGGYNHPVGMAVHDVMGSMSGPEEVMQPGFVFACDIQYIKPEEKIGIRLEDTVVITTDGCEVLSAALPRTIEEVETFMQEDGMIQILQKAKKY